MLQTTVAAAMRRSESHCNKDPGTVSGPLSVLASNSYP